LTYNNKNNYPVLDQHYSESDYVVHNKTMISH